MSENNRRRMTPEQLARRAEYLRRYRASHPGCTQRWRDAWVLRRARLLAEQAAERDGGSDGGD